MNQDIFQREGVLLAENKEMKEQLAKLKSNTPVIQEEERDEQYVAKMKVLEEAMAKDKTNGDLMAEMIESHKQELQMLNDQHTDDLKLKDKKRHQGYLAYEQQLQQLKDEMVKA
mmetsp:Transcript_4738/g.8101  ORF Transcript_4738/g.8101 Transcript_4738/m.8101 type:complete len:114 (-) Transcript_4738:524-865(-)